MHPQNLTLFDDPEIADIIDHINEDHSDDMKHMALGLLNLKTRFSKNLKKMRPYAKSINKVCSWICDLRKTSRT